MQNDVDRLILNIDDELGKNRIKRNLNIDTYDVVDWCKQKIISKNSNIYRKGKNWYIDIDSITITANASSYTIITAHRK